MIEKNIEDYLLKLLTYKLYTRRQLMRKLTDKGAEIDEAEALLNKYSAYGYVNDSKYAKLYVNSHEEWGKIRLAAELRGRGIDSSVIEETLEVLEPDELARAEQLVRQWLDCGINKEKILGRLSRRGFSFSLCKEALDRACEGRN